MERLLEDAEKLTGEKYDIKKFSDVVKAINAIQKQMNITGTTAKEAEKTISGSISSLKAAFQNLVVGFSDENADLDVLSDNVYNSLNNVLNNLTPVIWKILKRLPNAIAAGAEILSLNMGAIFDYVFDDLAPAISESLGNIADYLSDAFDIAFDSLGAHIGDIPAKLSKALTSVMRSLASRLPYLFASLAAELPDIFGAGGEIATSLADTFFIGMASAVGNLATQLPTLAPVVLSGVLNLFQSVAKGISGVFNTLLTAMITGDTIAVNDQIAKMIDESYGADGTLTVDLKPEVEVEEPEPPEIPTEITDSISQSLQSAYETMTNGILKDDKGAQQEAQAAIVQSLAGMTDSVNDWQTNKVAEINADDSLSLDEKKQQIADVLKEAENMRTSIEEAATASEEWLNANSEAATSIVQGNKEQLDSIVTGLTDVETRLNTLKSELHPEELTGEDKTLGQQIVDSLGEGIDTANLQAVFEGVGQAISTGLTKGIEGLANGATSIIDAITGLIDSALTKVGDEGTFSASLASLGTSILDAIVKSIALVGTGTTRIIQSLSTLLETAFNGLTGEKFTTYAKTLGTSVLDAITGAITAAGTAGGSIILALSDLLDKALTKLGSEEFNTQLQTIGDNIIKALTDSFDAAKDASGTIFNAVKTLFTKALSPENLTGIIDNAFDFATNIIEGFAGAISTALTGDQELDFSGLATAILDSLVAAIGAIGTGAGKLITTIGDVLSGLFSGDGLAEGVSINLESLGTALITGIGEAIKAAASSAGTIITAIGNAITGLFSESMDGQNVDLTSLASGLGSAIGEALTDVTIGASEIATSIGNLFSTISASDFSGKLASIAMSIVSELVTALGSEDFSSAVNAIGAGLGSAAGVLLNSAITLADQFIVYFLQPDTWAKLGTGLWSIIQGIFAGLDGLIKGLIPETPVKTVQEYVESLNKTFDPSNLVFDSFGNIDVVASFNLKPDGSNSSVDFGAMAQFLQDSGLLESYEYDEDLNLVLNAVPTEDGLFAGFRIEDLTAMYDEWLASHPVEAEVPVETSITTDDQDATTDMFTQQIETQFSENGVPVDADVEVNAGDVTVSEGTDSAIQTALDQSMLGKSYTTTVNFDINASGATGDANAAVKGALAQLDAGALAAYNAGQSFGQGFINGMSSKLSAVIEQAKQLGDEAKRSLQASIKQGSPSKITMESGRFFGEGFAIGIKDSIGDVRDAVSKMASIAANMAQVSGSFGSKAIAITAATENKNMIDYDRLADAVAERPMYADLNGKRIASVNAENTASVQNARSRDVAYRFGA